MTTADAYGPLAELTQLVDEYYQVERLDPSKLPILQQQIWELIRDAHLDEDLKQVMTRGHGHTHEWDEGATADGTPLALASMQGNEVAHVLGELDAYLCELTGAQIRDGLHILGRPPGGEQLLGLLQAITRVPNLEAPATGASVASLFELDLGSLLDDLARGFPSSPASWPDSRAARSRREATRLRLSMTSAIISSLCYNSICLTLDQFPSS